MVIDGDIVKSKKEIEFVRTKEDEPIKASAWFCFSFWSYIVCLIYLLGAIIFISANTVKFHFFMAQFHQRDHT